MHVSRAGVLEYPGTDFILLNIIVKFSEQHGDPEKHIILQIC